MTLKRAKRLGSLFIASAFCMIATQNCQGFKSPQFTNLSSSGSSLGTPNPTPTPPGTSGQPDLWYFHSSYLSGPDAVQSSLDLIDQAVAAGYTGLVFDDGFVGGDLMLPGKTSQYVTQVINYALSKNLKVLPGTAPVGWADSILRTNSNLAEGIKVVGSQFKVVVGSGGDHELQFINSYGGFPNGDFSSGISGWGAATPSDRVTLDTTVFHSAPNSIRISGIGGVGTSGNGRVIHSLTVQPWRTYHLSVWYKLQGAPGGNQVVAEMFDPAAATHATRIPWTVLDQFSADKDWTRIDLAFNSEESTALNLYIGVWGDFKGSLWFDDFQMEEVGLVNVLNRGGTPTKVYDPNGTAVYTEGIDYNSIHDPLLESNNGVFTYYHTPPTVTLPTTSQLKIGQIVAIDSYSAFPTDLEKTATCLLEPGVIAWVKQHAQALDAIMPAGSGYFMQQDEIREMHTCALCKSQANSAGDLLVKHMGLVIGALKSVRPKAPLYVWNDMFDPYHNANSTSSESFLIDGDLTGSWNGLTSDIIIMNWNLGKLSQSSRFFAGMDATYPTVAHQQVVAGYYDTGDGASEANKEMDSVVGVPGITGFMYTTWAPDYSQLKNYADAVRARWPAYLKSIGK